MAGAIATTPRTTRSPRPRAELAPSAGRMSAYAGRDAWPLRRPAGRPDGQFRSRPHEHRRRPHRLPGPDPHRRRDRRRQLLRNAALRRRLRRGEAARRHAARVRPAVARAACTATRITSSRCSISPRAAACRASPCTRSSTAATRRRAARARRSKNCRSEMRATSAMRVIATICGRYYAMDRDKRWDRVQLAYDAIAEAHRRFHADSALAALDAAYARGENDEFVKPTVIGDGARIADGDAVVFMNFRADRARELTQAFVDAGLRRLRARARRSRCRRFVTLTEYDERSRRHRDRVRAAIDCTTRSANISPRIGLKQLRIAETEKYAHVTFFFSGGREAPFAGEERILVPSPKVATYDLQAGDELPRSHRQTRRGDRVAATSISSSATSPTPTWSATPASRRPRSRRSKRSTSRSAARPRRSREPAARC